MAPGSRTGRTPQRSISRPTRGNITAVMLPLVGRLIDRWGVRPVLLPGAILFALATAAMSLVNGSPAVLFGLYAVFGLLAATTTPMGYSKAVASWFDKQRGLALGIA